MKLTHELANVPFCSAAADGTLTMLYVWHKVAAKVALVLAVARLLCTQVCPSTGGTQRACDLADKVSIRHHDSCTASEVLILGAADSCRVKV